MDVFNLEGNRYKANLHTHSTTSDGVFAPQEILKLYKKEGYEVVALTDHRKTNAVSKLRIDGLTVLSGMEMHPAWRRASSGELHHILALNVPEDFEDCSALPCQDCIDRAIAAGGCCFMPHPYWTGLNPEDILKLKGLSGIEVYNSSARYIGRQFNMVHWDALLCEGWRIPAIAVDDSHRACDLFHGWTVVCAKNRSPASVVDALKKGHSYSSMGPEFHSFDVDFKTRRIKAEFSPAVDVVLVSNIHDGWCVELPGFRADVKGGRAFGCHRRKAVESFEIEVPARLKHVRCQIMDKNGLCAWSNPVYFD